MYVCMYVCRGEENSSSTAADRGRKLSFHIASTPAAQSSIPRGRGQGSMYVCMYVCMYDNFAGYLACMDMFDIIMFVCTLDI